jgi:hypothetical protein
MPFPRKLPGMSTFDGVGTMMCLTALVSVGTWHRALVVVRASAAAVTRGDRGVPFTRGKS